MPHICVSELLQHWFKQWLVAWSAPSRYINQCWLVVNWTIWGQFSVKFESKYKSCHSRNFIWKCRLCNGGDKLNGICENVEISYVKIIVSCHTKTFKMKIEKVILFHSFCFRCWRCPFVSAELPLHSNHIYVTLRRHQSIWNITMTSECAR